MVLSYYPASSFILPKYFDDSVYLLEKRIPPIRAIVETNKLLVERVDYIVSGIRRDYGGAYIAYRHAQKHKKIILNLFDKEIYHEYL